MAKSINLQNTVLKISAGTSKQFPLDPVMQIAFSGRSNVGKSSLINCILGCKKTAHVSSTPGKTITVNFFLIDGKLYFVDLPGYGFAKRPNEEKQKWSSVTDEYFTKNRNIDRLALVLQLIDAKVGPTKDDVMMLQYLNQAGLPFAVVATKCDKLNKTEFGEAVKRLESHPDIQPALAMIPFSTVTNEGKIKLLSLLSSVTDLKL